MGGNSPPAKRRSANFLLGIILLAGLVNGLLFVFIMPPWQHYDEPSHFEYAWLLANRGTVPEPGFYDQGMRREVAASMIEHGFFEGTDFRPNLLSQTEPVWIGIPQDFDPPLYYWIVALPLRLAIGNDVDFQLYLGRLVSLGLFLICLLAAYGVMAEITHPGHWLRWTVPAAMALMPALVDIMTAVNNDVGATAFFSLFLWVGIRLILKGINWKRLAILLILTVACLATKNTAVFALPMFFVAILLAWIPGKKRRWIWVTIVLAAAIAIFAGLDFNAAATWHLLRPSTEPIRTPASDAPAGKQIFRLPYEVKQAQRLIQFIPTEIANTLMGQTVTWGAWLWADSSMNGCVLALYQGDQMHCDTVDLEKGPVFFSFKTVLAQEEASIRIGLLNPHSEVKGSIFMDGAFLVLGDYSQSGPPAEFQESQLEWGDRSLSNVIRNPSAEQGWPRLRPWATNILKRIYPANPAVILTSLSDLAGTGWYYKSAAENLFRTFWGKFGWGQVPLVGDKPYRIFMGLTLAAIAGFAGKLWIKRKTGNRDLFLWLGMGMIFIWGAAITRGVYSLLADVFIPAARYTYPSIIPTMTVLVIGFQVLLDWLFRRWDIKPEIPGLLILLVFLCIDVWGLASILAFYYI